MPPKKTQGTGTGDQPVPQPNQPNPLDEHVSHIEFIAAFTTLDHSVVAYNECLATFMAKREANTTAFRIWDFTQMNPPLFFGSKSDKDPQVFLDQV